MMFRFSDDRYDEERDSARTMDTRESYEHNNNTGCNNASRGDWAATDTRAPRRIPGISGRIRRR